MRKYDKKNKRSIFIIVLICVLILVALSIFIVKVREMDKATYIVDANSVLFDVDKNRWTLDGTGTVKVKWSGNYYLAYQDEEIRLDKRVVVFNNATKYMTLFGTIYKINEDESVDTLKDETIIDDVVAPKFYKLADRKYLIIAESISNTNGTFSTENYLIVELDKMGNAVLTNNRVNMKTLTATTLVTKTFEFDIANEVLTIGNAKIDLKKIIGSTNLYTPPKEEEVPDESGKDNQSGNASENSGDNTSAEQNENPSEPTDIIDEPSEIIEPDKKSEIISSITDTRIYQDKNFSIVKNTVGLDYLSIDYSIYDPKSEFKNVYVEVTDDTTKVTETYFLAKNATNLTIKGLTPDNTYYLAFKYSYLDGEMNTNYESFNVGFDSIKTALPEISIVITKMTQNLLSYNVSTETPIMYGTVIELLSWDRTNNSYEKLDEKEFTTASPSKTYSGSFNIADYADVSYFAIRVASATYSSGTAEPNVILRVKN